MITALVYSATITVRRKDIEFTNRSTDGASPLEPTVRMHGLRNRCRLQKTATGDLPKYSHLKIKKKNSKARQTESRYANVSIHTQLQKAECGWATFCHGHGHGHGMWLQLRRSPRRNHDDRWNVFFFLPMMYFDQEVSSRSTKEKLDWSKSLLNGNGINIWF
jgi:hypothetical protein